MRKILTAVFLLLVAALVAAPQTNTFCANNLACTVSALWNFSSGNLQLNGVGVADVSSAQSVSNKTLTSSTLDISANTLKNSSNTAGHVPRNNGTQYVDAQLGAADLSNGTTGSGAAALATSAALVTPSIGGETISSSPRVIFTCFFPGAITSTWVGCSLDPDKNLAVTRIDVVPKTIPLTCAIPAKVRLTDGSANMDVTIANSATNDFVVGPQNYASGNFLNVQIITAAGSCGTSPTDLNVVIQYKMQ